MSPTCRAAPSRAAASRGRERGAGTRAASAPPRQGPDRGRRPPGRTAAARVARRRRCRRRREWESVARRGRECAWRMSVGWCGGVDAHLQRRVAWSERRLGSGAWTRSTRRSVRSASGESLVVVSRTRPVPRASVPPAPMSGASGSASAVVILRDQLVCGWRFDLASDESLGSTKRNFLSPLGTGVCLSSTQP